jgi:16S rRNA pseudouridine516 synthase
VSLVKYLGALGYGSRREVTALLAARRVTRADGAVIRDGDPWSHEAVRVDDTPLDPPPGTIIMLHKPLGYVCSLRDVPPLVYDLLPARWPLRRPVMATVGRLDRESSGLLLLTDDGALNHRLTSPRAQHTKTYRCTLSSALRGDEAATFASGTLRLHGEPDALAPVQMRILDDHAAELVLTEGRYHQIRRMFAAVGNHVVTLHRTAVGALTLGDLTPGAWRVLDGDDRQRLWLSPSSPPGP